MKLITRNKLAALCLFVVSALAQAQVPLQVATPWVRATVPQQGATGAFMQLTAERKLRLLEVRSSVAGTVELHRMAMEGGVMKMRQIAYLDLPAGQTVALQPGGYHVMLFDLKRQVKEGERVPLTLVVQDEKQQRFLIDVDAPARALNAAPATH